MTFSWASGGSVKVDFVWDKSTSIPEKDGAAVPIKGIAADGTARMYIVVSKAFPQVGAAIQRVEMYLYDPQNKTSRTSILGKLKYSALQNNSSYTEDANTTNTVSAQSLSSNQDGKYWFWYVAPDDFTEDGREEDDQSSRNVECSVAVYYQGSSTPEERKIAIPIVRPPLMCVHGINSDQSAWDAVGVINEGLVKYVHKPNMYPGGSYLQNARVLMGLESGLNPSQQPSILGAVQQMRTNGYVANQVDYVAHSMGGSMLRMALHQRDSQCILR